MALDDSEFKPFLIDTWHLPEFRSCQRSPRSSTFRRLNFRQLSLRDPVQHLSPMTPVKGGRSCSICPTISIHSTNNRHRKPSHSSPFFALLHAEHEEDRDFGDEIPRSVCPRKLPNGLKITMHDCAMSQLQKILALLHTVWCCCFSKDPQKFARYSLPPNAHHQTPSPYSKKGQGKGGTLGQ